MTIYRNNRSVSQMALAIALASFCGISHASAQVLATDDNKVSDEIVVTASGRKTSALDIPYNLTVKSGDDLEKANVTDIAGLSRQVPGMIYTDQGARSNGINNGIILRGLNGATTTGAITPALGGQLVSIYMDSVPLFSNLKIADIERVEVLRGPQGTLYGAGSIGGTVRFIFNKPDFTKVSGSIQSKIGTVSDAGDPTYAFDGVFNLPITDRFALRVSGGYEKIPGVIDATNLTRYSSTGIPVLANPSDYFGSVQQTYRQNDVDDADVYYVRGAARLKVTDDVEATLSIQHQETNASDFSGQNPTGPEREHTRFRTSPSKTDVTLYAFELSADLGFATFTSSTSYSRTDVKSNYDATNYGLQTQGFYAGFPRITSNSDVNFTDKMFVEEARLVSAPGGDWDWAVGAYHSDFRRNQAVRTFTPGWQQYTNTPGHPEAVAALGDPAATWADYQRTIYPDGTFDSDLVFTFDRRIKTKNTAIYGELTYHLTPKWSVTGGGRYFWVKPSQATAQTFPASGASGAFQAAVSSSISDRILKANTSYNFSKAAIAYFTWSQGFREGGGNALPVTGPFAQDPSLLSYVPDFVDNFEVGLKGAIGGSVRYSLALYKDIWKQMQIQITAPGGFPALVNGGEGMSQGLEFETQISPVRGLDLNFGYAYTDAELTEDFSRRNFRGSKGDKLPGVPEHSVSGGFNYTMDKPIFGGEVSYHADAAYRSKVKTSISEAAGNFAILPGFATVNASINWTGEHIRGSVFVNNLTDVNGVTAVAINGGLPGDVYFIQRPRTIGISLGYKF